MIVKVRAVANCYFKNAYRVAGDTFDFELAEGKTLPDCLVPADNDGSCAGGGTGQDGATSRITARRSRPSKASAE